MRPDDFDIQKVIDHLQGTAGTLDGAIEELYPGMNWLDFTSEDHDAIDNEIFLCEECGWWCEVSQYGMEDGKCDDCSPDG